MEFTQIEIDFDQMVFEFFCFDRVSKNVIHEGKVSLAQIGGLATEPEVRHVGLRQELLLNVAKLVGEAGFCEWPGENQQQGGQTVTLKPQHLLVYVYKFVLLVSRNLLSRFCCCFGRINFQASIRPLIN
jgi:hypothetical protein